ncbi:MAG: hypothetical protein OMM_06559 [Candidatus Magnetoglobus multicellularis str. Araruama]|uniref:Uncharacterized protein n=1 Tax=Candidatus Magnetoglobus multicellularis str. Araruama TaxID=890399 RepID=A0A1V1PGM1_9BACT|nr:MAG: hypothetical protein OMM_06559 [Candidatus Magnetoglobus multicellularis str. Araruama]
MLRQSRDRLGLKPPGGRAGTRIYQYQAVEHSPEGYTSIYPKTYDRLLIIKQRIETIENEKLLKAFFRKLPAYKNFYEIEDALDHSKSIYGKDGFTYQHTMFKWIA